MFLGARHSKPKLGKHMLPRGRHIEMGSIDRLVDGYKKT